MNGKMLIWFQRVDHFLHQGCVLDSKECSERTSNIIAYYVINMGIYNHKFQSTPSNLFMMKLNEVLLT